MKKVISMLLAVVMVFSMATTALAATVTPEFSTTAVKAGEDVTVTLKLDEAIEGVVSLDYRLYFDPNNFTLKSSANGTAHSAMQISNLKTDSKGTCYMVSFVDTTSEGQTIAAGTLYTLVFTANADLTEEQSVSFELVNKGVYSPTYSLIDAPVSNGTVSVSISPAVSESAYTVTIADSIANGTVVADVTEAAEGATVTLTATPAGGYELDAYTVTDASGAAVTVTDGKFTMPASNVTVSATFKETVVTAGYSVTASEDVSITAGENAEVSITVTEADSKAYNAYELNVSYPEGLTYVKAEGLDENFQANHDETNRTIQIIGYGADKASGTAAAKLTFTGSTVGEYDVTITSAKVDAAAAAPTQDTPDATIVDNITKITVTGYTVTLGEGLTADSTVANPGEGYTFTPTDDELYDYTITAKIGDTPITVTPNEDGSYTIPADQITGNITITAEMTPKTFGVTIDGEEQETGATYKTDYVFTPEKEGHTVSGVTVTIGGNEYTGWTSSEGTYTIPGDAITGDIVITIDWTAVTPEVKTYTVTKSEGIIGADTATEGTDYTFSFGETDKYDYSGLKVMVGETDITEQVTKNEETGVYTIPAALITGNITIEVTRTEKSTLTIDVVQYLTVDGGNMYLVTVKDVPEGSVAKYDGLTMYWSEKYEAYAWLVISTDTLENVKTAAAAVVTAAEGTADLTVDYSGDVNGTDKVDVNDAQLVYNMYNAYYGDFTTATMQKFLDADMNGDKTVNVSDAAAVVTVITGKQA